MCKNGIFICIWNHYVLHNGELSFPNAWNSISLYFSQAPKTRSVALFYFSILMFTSVQSLIAHSQQSTKSDVLKFGPVSELLSFRAGNRHMSKIFCLMAAVSRSDKAICSIFRDSPDSILRVGLSGCCVERTTTACQFHMTSLQFMRV